MADQFNDSNGKIDPDYSMQNPLDKLTSKEIDMCNSTELTAMLEASEKQLQVKA